MSPQRKDLLLPLKKDNRGSIRERLFGAVQVDPFLLRPGFQKWLINIFLSLILAILFQFPRGESSMVGSYTIGEIAGEDIYAPTDMNLTDTESTAAKKQQAEKNVWPVFDYDPRKASIIESRIHKIFSDFRALYQTEWDWNEAEKNRMDILRRELRQRGRPLPYLPDENLAEREARLKESFINLFKDINPTPINISEKQFQALKQDHYSEDMENKIVAVTLQVMNEGVVTDREKLPIKDGEGITVRVMPFRDPARDEYPKGDISAIHTIEEARKLINDRSWDQWGKELSRNQRAIIVDLAQQLVLPNYSFDQKASEQKLADALESVQPTVLRIKKGEKIIGKGEVVNDEVARKLRLINKPTGSTSLFAAILGNFIWIAAFLGILYGFPAKTIRKFKPATKDLINLSIIMVLLMAMLKFVVSSGAGVGAGSEIDLAYLVPLVTGAMMIRLLLNSETAVIFSVGMAVLAGMMTKEPSLAMFVLVGSMVGANEVGQARTRTSIARAGFVTGMANVSIVLALSMRDGHFLDPANAYNVMLALGGGILASILVLGLTPILEAAFGYVTDIRLLELANQEHPLLKSLIVNAPGTYQHSIMVGTLVEAAAESIHVNPLLAKVGALYHDVGKMEKPVYYVENQRDGVNKHDKLTPSMSSLIIASHVKYGMELARMYRLPPAIVDLIPQHHGTSLIKYFYARAKEREDPDLQHVEEKDFRYGGPKPQTREAGILMLADSVEATARSLPDPTPAKLKGMVKRIINGIFSDGQLDECELTLKDINAISEAFTDVLTSIYHSRPEYPQAPGGGQGKRSGAQNGGRRDGGGHSPRETEDGPDFEGSDQNTKTTRKNSIRSTV